MGCCGLLSDVGVGCCGLLSDVGVGCCGGDINVEHRISELICRRQKHEMENCIYPKKTVNMSRTPQSAVFTFLPFVQENINVE